MSRLITEWLCIGTEGDTVDDRDMNRQSLIDMGETYDPGLYAALIWPEHERDYGNFGEVVETMWSEDDSGLVKLYARIRPNLNLIRANQEDQLVYFSVEMCPGADFRGTGRDYLMGLGVTDSPASVGTSRLRFSRRKKNKTGQYGYIFCRDGTIKQESEMNNWQKLFGIKPKYSEEGKGSEGESEKPAGDVKTLADVVNDLEARVIALEKQQEATQSDVDEIAEAVDTEEFSTVLKNAKTIVSNFSKLDKRVTKLPKHEPDGKDKKFKFI